jgi:phytol kinase
MEAHEFSLGKELQRKAVHATALLIVIGYYLLPKEVVLLIMTFFLILFLEIEFVRIDLKLKLPLFQGLYRDKEEDTLGGNVFFLIGAIVAVSVFSKEIAIAAILMTTFGDAAAALIGKRFGKIRISWCKNKAIEGCAAEFIVDIFIGFIFLNSWSVILVMAGTATVVETVVNKIDDNLIIPVFSGFNAQILMYLIALGYLPALPVV